jgi:hypothetical protein
LSGAEKGSSAFSGAETGKLSRALNRFGASVSRKSEVMGGGATVSDDCGGTNGSSDFGAGNSSAKLESSSSSATSSSSIF